MSLFLIAEIGINHNGDLGIVRELIDAAADAGFDAVKFQKRTLENVYTREFLDSPRESPWGSTQRDQKTGLEFERDAQLLLRDFDLSFNKVAAAMRGHHPLVREIASEGRRAIISTGMSTIEEIDGGVDLFRQHGCPFELLHCNSTYPMREEDANLRCIPMLRDRYGCDVGYSGHESSGIKVCVTAVALGATTIERHITLDRAMYGSDQAASLEVASLRSFAETVRRVPQILGTGEKVSSEAESAVREKLRVDVVG